MIALKRCAALVIFATIALVDSTLRSGAGLRLYNGHWEHLLLARLYEMRDDLPKALAAVRSRAYARVYPATLFLSASLREEGRIAALAGDRDGAIRAYRWYLSLLTDPEAAILPARDRARAALAQLQSVRR
jgi:hypothetical protein